MTTVFKVGDRVRYKKTDEFPRLKGWEAEVVEINLTSKGTTRVRTLKNPGNATGTYAGKTGLYYTNNLELIDSPFTFADIQVGDKIRRTYTRETGTTEVREGVVSRKDESVATDTSKPIGSYILAYSSDGDPAKPQVKLELLERPEKELELWEDRKPGDKIVTYLSDGLDRIFTKREDGLWDTLVYTSGKKIGKGFPRADQDIAAYLTKQTVTAEIVK